jgi:hypothetical protein
MKQSGSRSLDKIDDEDHKKRHLELRRQRIYAKLLTRERNTPMERRVWFCLAEIADACATAPGQLKPDPTLRQTVIELLRTAVLRGDFENSPGKSRIAFLHTSPHTELGFKRAWAENATQWIAWNSFSPAKWDAENPISPCPPTIWMRRTDCAAWLAKEEIDPPKKLSLTSTPVPPEQRELAHSGAPGRPTSRSLIESELHRRINALGQGEPLGEKISAVCDSLSDWLKEKHPTLPHMTAKTIQNIFASLIRPHITPSRN